MLFLWNFRRSQTARDESSSEKAAASLSWTNDYSIVRASENVERKITLLAAPVYIRDVIKFFFFDHFSFFFSQKFLLLADGLELLDSLLVSRAVQLDGTRLSATLTCSVLSVSPAVHVDFSYSQFPFAFAKSISPVLVAARAYSWTFSFAPASYCMSIVGWYPHESWLWRRADPLNLRKIKKKCRAAQFFYPKKLRTIRASDATGWIQRKITEYGKFVENLRQWRNLDVDN